MDPKTISNHELLLIIKDKTTSERKLTLEILHLLREVEVRRLYLERGYSSLHRYCVDELHYSDSAAQRRIQSMRLLFEVPVVEKSLRDGSLSLSNMAQVQSFFNAQLKVDKHYSGVEKQEILKSVEGKSRREAEKALLGLDPEAQVKNKETIKPVTSTQTKIEMIVDARFIEKVEKLKSLLSHKNPDLSFKGLVEILIDQALKKLDPSQKQTAPIKSNSPAAMPTEAKEKSPQGHAHASRFIPAKIKREIWVRDRGMCQFEDPLTKRKCSSTYRLEYDH